MSVREVVSVWTGFNEIMTRLNGVFENCIEPVVSIQVASFVTT
jgi:hypothetical protein